MARENLQEERSAPIAVSPARAGDHVEAIKILHEQLVSPLAALFTEALSTEVKLEVTSAGHTIFGGVEKTFTDPCCSYSFAPEPGQKRVVLDLGMELASALAGRRTIAGETWHIADTGGLSRAELLRLNEYAKQILNDLASIWENVAPMALYEPVLETNPFYEIANTMGRFLDPGEPIYHVLLTARWADETSRLNLCYPSASLAEALSRLEPR